MTTTQCARCGAPAADAIGGQPACEACKWAILSHQPVAGPSTAPLGTGLAAAGLAVPTFSAKAAGVGVPPQSRVAARRGNLPMACVSGVAAAVVLAGVAYGFVVWAEDVPWWLFLVLGAGIGTATYRGNGHQITGQSRVAAVVIGAAASLVLEYAAYRHLALGALRQRDAASSLPAVLSWNQIRFLFEHAGGVDWRLLPAIAAAGAAVSRPGWARKGTQR